MQKQLEGTQKYINEQCRQSCPYRWQLRHAIIVSINSFQRSINAQSNKTEQSIYECLLASVLTTFSAPQILAASPQFSSAQFQKRRNDG